MDTTSNSNPSDEAFFDELFGFIFLWHCTVLNSLKDGVKDFFLQDLKTSVAVGEDVVRYYKETGWESILDTLPEAMQALFLAPGEENEKEPDKEKPTKQV
jgi:hypothetical protein